MPKHHKIKLIGYTGKYKPATTQQADKVNYFRSEDRVFTVFMSKQNNCAMLHTRNGNYPLTIATNKMHGQFKDGTEVTFNPKKIIAYLEYDF